MNDPNPQSLLNLWFAIEAGLGGKTEMQYANPAGASPTPIQDTCARAVYSGREQLSQDPAPPSVRRRGPAGGAPVRALAVAPV